MIINYLRRALDLLALACCCYVLGLYSKDIYYFVAGITENPEDPERSAQIRQRSQDRVLSQESPVKNLKSGYNKFSEGKNRFLTDERGNADVPQSPGAKKRVFDEREHANVPQPPGGKNRVLIDEKQDADVPRSPGISHGTRYLRNQEQNAENNEENADTRKVENNEPHSEADEPSVPRSLPKKRLLGTESDGEIVRQGRNYKRKLIRETAENRDFPERSRSLRDPVKVATNYETRDAANEERVNEINQADSQSRQRFSNTADDETNVMTRKSKKMRMWKLNQEDNQNYENDERNAVKEEQYVSNQDRQNQNIENQGMSRNIIHDERSGKRFVNKGFKKRFVSSRQEFTPDTERNYVQNNERGVRNANYESDDRQIMPIKRKNINKGNMEYRRVRNSNNDENTINDGKYYSPNTRAL